ncbi:MAG: cysteine synthase A [Acholeplasmataceae bacterium]|jgi:cysteine synthase A|nr:cysteine synthase A [Acholeplasmataceae bacterium]
MKIYQNYTELIGKTPLLRLHRLEKLFNLDVELVAKLENHNPLSSVKDRLAYALIQALEEHYTITDQTHFVEPTSGNTGIGLAYICAAKGYKLTLIMPESVSKERVQIVKALGANVILTDKSLGMKGSIQKAYDLQKEDQHVLIPMQFENLANPEIHRKTTALEILADTDHQLDYFIAGVGTGGTITGVGEVLKDQVKQIRIIAVEPKDSPVLSGGLPGPHTIQGIGAGFIPKILNQAIIDEIVQVPNEEAFHYARLLAKEEGVFAGISTGAILYAAIKIAQRKEARGKRIVFIVCDTGERYLSTPLYDL